MYLEITYTIDGKTSWTYFQSKSDDFTKATTEAGKYFKTFARESGWTKSAKLKSILKIHNEIFTTPASPPVCSSSGRSTRRSQPLSRTQTSSQPKKSK